MVPNPHASFGSNVRTHNEMTDLLLSEHHEQMSLNLPPASTMMTPGGSGPDEVESAAGCLQSSHLGSSGINPHVWQMLEPSKSTAGSLPPAVPGCWYSGRQSDFFLGFHAGPIWSRSGKAFERKVKPAIAFIEHGRVTGTDFKNQNGKGWLRK